MKKLIGLVMALGMAFCLTQYSELLVTPGLTATVDVNGNISHTFQYYATNVSTNVAVMPQGTLDKRTWFNILSTPTTLNASGTYYDTKATTPMFGVRMQWISKSGVGTTPNIRFTYMGSKY